jgi:hypothetical protein
MVDGYFNATLFLSYYNNSVHEDNTKNMKDFKVLKSTEQFIRYLIDVEGIEVPIRASNKVTWMCPKVFVDFCMWVSLEFKSKAIDWVLDGLVKSRNDSGDYYNRLTATIIDVYVEDNGVKPMPIVYINEALMLKGLAGIVDRNIATEGQLRVLNTLQLLDIKLLRDRVGKDARRNRLQELSDALKDC